MKDKCGIVTAAGSGMGRAGAVRFAREGATVAVIDIDADAVLPEIRARGGGALFYTASTSGLRASSFSPVYSAVKHGVVGFVKALGKRLAKENIHVNAICPGPIDTPMLRVFVARPDQQSTHGLDKEQLVARRGDTIPMGRPGTPEEVASA